MQWERLVTDGHVRAARWRHAVPFFMATAVAAVSIGGAIMALLPKPQPSLKVFEAQSAYAIARQTDVSRFLQAYGAQTVIPPRTTGRMIPPTVTPTTISTLLAALNSKGQLPDNVRVVDADGFWRKSAGVNGIEAVRKDRTILIVYAAATGRRAFGLFRQGEGEQWRYYCLSVPGAEPCVWGAAINPVTIPATMRAFLPSNYDTGGAKG